MKNKTLIKNTQHVQLIETELKSSDCETDVLVKVSHIGLCRTDLQVANGTIHIDRDEIVLGHEFSAQIYFDPLSEFKKESWVGFNPLIEQKFMGLDFNGAICQYLWVKRENLVTTVSNNPKVIAYLEPVAASMAVMKVIDAQNINQKIAIVGDNRIASLTAIIVESFGLKCDMISEKTIQNTDSNTYDIVIETVFEEKVIAHTIRILKPNGKLIIKSRKKQSVGIISSDLVAKEICAQAVNYYSFSQAMQWLEKNYLLIEHLLGEDFYIDDWEIAFEKAVSSENKKIFIRVQELQNLERI